MAAPAAPCGRPRNAWNPARQRKLVRLYTLTFLTKEEIQNVLKAPDFSPSPRDIQNNLRALLPPDYTKEHRKYRPSNDTNMKLRLDHLRRCKRGRISKEKRSRSRTISRDTLRMEAFWELRTSSIASCEKFAHAFRDYTTLSNHDIPLVLSRDLDNSEPVSSSLLLLDGSSISPASTKLGSGITRNTSNDDVSSKPPSDSSTRTGLESTRPTTTPQANLLAISDKRASSIRGLGRQLADKYSETYLKRVNSIIRYSSSNSWRSSLTSFSSQASSLVSKLSAHDKSNAEEASYSPRRHSKSNPLATGPMQESVGSSSLAVKHGERTKASHPHDQKSTLFTVDEIEPLELEVWNELIDEEQVGPGLRPQYVAVSPLNRKCCGSLTYNVCGRCGFTPEHRRAITCGQMDSSSENFFINRSDFYGNTPLHCAAASVVQDGFWKLRHRSLLWPGVEVSRCNTIGETFLHILCRSGPRTSKDIADFLLILEDLYVADFPFSKRDYHGRTILYILFQNSESHQYSIQFLREIFRIMKPNLKVKDNAGFCVQEYLEQFDQGTIYNRGLRCLVNLYPLPRSPLLVATFQPNISANHQERYFRAWLDNARSEDITSIDDAVDNPLIAMLKFWKPDTSRDSFLTEGTEMMIRSGDSIHMRDRDGDTALAIAARRGLRPVVTLLIKNGAIVHSRNYRGAGILKQMEQALASARTTGDMSLWSGIWSCQIALVDAGAIIGPTDQDEWMSPSARLSLMKEWKSAL